MYINRDRFSKEEKKLKRYNKEKDVLDKIILIIKESNSLEDLFNNPFSYIYRLEKLKYDMQDYYSFRLDKSGDIRLIISINNEKNIVYLEYISMKHYEDFKNMLKDRR